MSDYSTVMSVGVSITTLGGAWMTIRKIAKEAEKSKKEQAAEILQAAKEEDALTKAKLELKIEHLESDLKSLSHDVNKDLSHLRETYNSEIRTLGAKIEDLRNELRNQHGQLVQLLSEMIKNRD